MVLKVNICNRRLHGDHFSCNSHTIDMWHVLQSRHIDVHGGIASRIPFPTTKDVTPLYFLPSYRKSIWLLWCWFLWHCSGIIVANVGELESAMMTSLLSGVGTIKIQDWGSIINRIHIRFYIMTAVESQEMHNCLMIDGVLVYISNHLTAVPGPYQQAGYELG